VEDRRSKSINGAIFFHTSPKYIYVSLGLIEEAFNLIRPNRTFPYFVLLMISITVAKSPSAHCLSPNLVSMKNGK